MKARANFRFWLDSRASSANASTHPTPFPLGSEAVPKVGTGRIAMSVFCKAIRSLGAILDSILQAIRKGLRVANISGIAVANENPGIESVATMGQPDRQGNAQQGAHQKAP